MNFISIGEIKKENKACFDYIYQQKDKIEEEFGNELTWERMDENVSCRIKYQIDGVSVYEKDDWDKMIRYLTDVAERMTKSFKKPVRQLNRKIKKGDLQTG